MRIEARVIPGRERRASGLVAIIRSIAGTGQACAALGWQGRDDPAYIFNRQKESFMSGTGDKIKGYTNEAVGNVKQGVGKLVGSEKLKAEGAIQELKGEAQQAIGSVKNAASQAHDNVTSSSTSDKAAGHYNDAAGTVKQTVGRAIGSAEMEAEGLAQEVKGEAQKISGDIKKTVGR
jgi:uncharacterized protein YjbJ (UPF0337 family)